MQMHLPEFFAASPRLRVFDPLADFLGAAQDGVFEYVYAASVLTLLTGATEDTGFKGIGGHFDRRGLLFFGADIPAQMRLTRLDSGESVDASARLDRVPGDPHTSQLMPRCLDGSASPEEANRFRALWQSRVRALLLEHADDPAVFEILH